MISDFAADYFKLKLKEFWKRIRIKIAADARLRREIEKRDGWED